MAYGIYVGSTSGRSMKKEFLCNQNLVTILTFQREFGQEKQLSVKSGTNAFTLINIASLCVLCTVYISQKPTSQESCSTHVNSLKSTN